MPDATFVLKEPTSKEPTLVYLFYYFNKKHLKYSTGIKIKPKYWNDETQLAKVVRDYQDAEEVNNTLKTLRFLINDRYRTLINDKITPTPEKLRIPLDDFLNKDAVNSDVKDLIVFAEELQKNPLKKFNTKKQYGQAIRNLKEFKQASKRSTYFDSIDLEFYYDFIKFLLDKKYGTNTIGTIIKNLKVFMNEAVERKLTNNLKYRNKRFKTMEEPSENIYLTQNEVKSIYNMNLKTNPKLDRVRDLFIIGCYTGLRFSDLAQLRAENLIDNKSKVKIKTEKTGETVIIPLHPYIKAILKKYNGVPPEIISNQKMNEYLKELGDWAGINESVTINSTKGGQKHTETFKKYELITVHTARRSFATNAYLNDVPTISIMKITGHRTEKSFLKYIKISQEDNANKLASHPFFFKH